MKRLRVILIILGSGLLISAIFLFLIGYLRPKGAGIYIETTPTATVFINGVQVGKTTYEATRAPGEVSLKLVPESSGKPLSSYETKIVLVSGIKTIVKREFGETESSSSGEIISFEKIGGNEVSFSVVSIPDAAQISIDGTPRAFAPYKTSAITVGEHQIIVSAPGFVSRTLSLKTVSGYKLTALVKLTPGGESLNPTPTPIPINTKVTMVEILETPTGFLRVRSTPSTGGSEVAQVKPGQKFTYLGEDEKTGWFHIEYEKGKEGWVTNQYARKVEVEGGSTSLPTPTPKPTLKPSPTPTSL